MLRLTNLVYNGGALRRYFRQVFPVKPFGMHCTQGIVMRQQVCGFFCALPLRINQWEAKLERKTGFLILKSMFKVQ